MQQNHLLLVAVAANGVGATIDVPAILCTRSLVATITGTGAVSATIIYEVSNDNGVNWAARLQFSLSGTEANADSGVDQHAPFSSVRARVLNLSGTNAAVSLSLCAV